MFTYDLATDVGKVRLLIPDIVESDKLFDNEDIQALLDLEGSVKLAAAQALDVAATDHARVNSYIKTQGLTVDGKGAAAFMASRSDRLRGQDDLANQADGFEVIELASDDFSAREIYGNSMLRDYFG